MQWNRCALFIVAVCSTVSWAQNSSVNVPSSSSSSSSVKSEELIDAIKQKKFNEDTRINDLQIRADAGSLSRYSGKFNIGYAGPNLTDVFGQNIPNPDNRTGDFRSYLSGTLGVNYRLTSNDSLYFSGGLKTYVSAKSGDNQDITDPGISYTHTYLFSDAVQARTLVLAKLVTNSVYRSYGETNGFTVSQIVKWNINKTHWIVGGTAEASGYLFNRGYDPKDRTITDYYFNFIPSVEYKLTRNLNFNTSVLKQISHYRKESNTTTFDASTGLWSQRVGVGYAATHDIYLNPYIAFFPEAMSWENASVGFTGIVSVF